MRVKVAKWGNSVAVRLPKRLADDLGLIPGKTVGVEKDGTRLAIETAPTPPWPAYRLQDLLAEMDRLGPEHERTTSDWGSAVGSEVVDDAYSHGEITLDDILSGRMLPHVGDIAWIELDPVKGSEQAGRRPALVLTSRGYHRRSRRAVVCPISSSERRWPFNVELPAGLKTRGAVLVDQVRAIERSERMFIIVRAPAALVAEVRGRLAALLGFDVGSFAAVEPT